MSDLDKPLLDKESSHFPIKPSQLTELFSIDGVESGKSVEIINSTFGGL